MNDLPKSTRIATVICCLACQQSISEPESDGAIERVGTLRTARAVHTATALPPYEVLVAGGMGGSGGSLSSAEIVDVATGGIISSVSMIAARAGHTSTALPDGRVVLIGGYDGSYLTSVEVFDPGRRRFTAAGQLNEGRSGHTATLLPDGRILVIGGVGQGWTFLASAEVFDPASGSSEMVDSLGVPRESHTATLLGDGRVLVTGGHRGRHEAMEVYASAEIFDPATGRFEPAGSMATARHKHDAVRLADGRVLVVGGADRTDRRYYASTEIWDPASGSFGPGPSMASTRYKIQGTSVRLPGGEVLVSGGARAAELLDRRASAFHSVPGSFPAAYYFATATPLANGDVIIIGGYGEGVASTAGVWRFRASTVR